MSSSVELLHWSTDAEAAGRRIDLYASFLSSSLSPMHMSAPGDGDFVAHFTAANLGLISVVRQHGSPHCCYQERADQARAFEKSYHLLINVATPWNIRHRQGHHLEPGDAMLVDSTLPWQIHIPTAYNFIHVKLADAWLRQWVPSPATLVGRPIGGRFGWGRALAAFAAQLSPEFFVDSPLPHSVIADHIGALLALSASQLTPVARNPLSGADKSLGSKVDECIAQRCCEPGLTADQVAQSVGVSVRTLHRCLANQDKSFGAVLVRARADAAIRMLLAPVFRRLTIAEIGHRAGFSDASHFSRVIRAHTGRTPSELRRSTSTANPEDGTLS